MERVDTTTKDRQPLFAGDLLRGAEAIGAFLGVPRRQAFYLCEKQLIPCGKLGAAWVASKAALREHYEKIVRPAG